MANTFSIDDAYAAPSAPPAAQSGGSGTFSVDDAYAPPAQADFVGATGIPAGKVGEAIHDLGVAGRAAEVGLAKGASILYDPAAALINLGSRGVNAAVDAITGKQSDPIGYIKPLSEQAENAADAAGLPQATTDTGKIAAKAVEGAASVLPTMGAGAVLKGMEAAPAVVRTVGEMLTAAPAVQAVSAAGGSAAGELAKQHGANTAEQVGASLAGGLTAGGSTVILKDGVPAGWRLVQQLTEDLLSPNAADKRAGEALLRSSSDPATLPARLQAAASAPSTPGVQPTTGQAAADPGLLAAQNGLQSTEPRAAGLIANRNAANNTAWQSTLDGMAPHGAGADAVQGAVRSAFQNFQGATDEMIGRATQRAQDALTALGAHITPERAGAIIRQAVNGEYTAARGTTRAAYGAVDPTGESSVPTAPLYTPAAQAVSDRYAASTFGTPDDLNRILTRLRDTSHASLDQIDGIRRDLGDIAGDLNRSASDRSVARQLVGHIDDYLNDVATNGAPGSNLTPEQTAAMQNARAARTAQGDTFERGSVGNVTRTKPYGEPAVPDSGVAAEFLFKGSGSPEAVQQFMAAVGTRPAAVSALQNYAATQLREFATNPDGTINPQRLTRWVQDHRPVLEQFPELNTRIGSAMRAQGLVDSLTGRQTRAIDDVQKSALGYFLGDTNPDAAVAKILNSSSSHADMDRLLNVIGHDPDAMAGLRRAIVDHMLGKSTNAGTDIAGNNLLSQAKFGANLDRYGQLLDRVFPPEQVAAMRQIQADLDRQQLSTAAKALGSNTVQNLSAASLLSNVSKGTIPLDNPIVQNLMRPYSWILKLPEQRVREILTDAMLDPDLALRLVQGVKPASSASLSLALRQRAAALGIGAAESTQAGEPKQLPGAAIGTAISSGQSPQHLSTGGVVTEHKDLKSFLADKRPLKQILAETKAKQAAPQPAVATAPHVAPTDGTGHRHSPVKVAAPHHAAVAGEKVAIATPGQKDAGNYQKGHITWNGLSITVETPKGGTRTDKDGKWEVPDFPAHYGYLKRTVGADHEQVDVFFGDHPESQRVWVIDQVDPATRKFDEHKCVLAAMTPKEARDLYASAFSDGSGHARVGAFTMMTVKQFKNWLKRGKRTKPLGHLPPPRSGASRAAQPPAQDRSFRPATGAAAS